MKALEAHMTDIMMIILKTACELITMNFSAEFREITLFVVVANLLQIEDVFTPIVDP